MMFDEKDVFKGLKAWFSSSVPTTVACQWTKHGGLKTNKVDDADFIFSSKAAAKDTIRIFESERYKNEEVTIFNSSLIEDTLSSGKMYLSGKYTGSYILVHPAYQREIDSFLRKKCPRFLKIDERLPLTVYNIRTGGRNIKGEQDIQQPTENGNGAVDDGDFQSQSQEGAYQANEKETSSEWDFKDESDIRVTNLTEARRLSQDPVNRNDKNGIDLCSSLLLVNKESGETLCHVEAHMMSNSSTESRKCLLHGTEVNNLDENYSVICMNDNHQSRNMEGDEEERPNAQDVEEKESFLDGTFSKNQRTSDSPAISRSCFVSSMDDGVVHIDDIKLPVAPIEDFIPNCNGCRVLTK